jgi:hypothetical protein
MGKYTKYDLERDRLNFRIFIFEILKFSRFLLTFD